MKKTAIVMLFFALPFLTGCFSTDTQFKEVRNDVIKTCKEGFSEETEFAIGSIGLSFAGLFVSAEEDPIASELIDDLSGIQVGVYKRHSGERTYSNSQVLKRIDKRMRRAGYTYIVRNCSKDEVSAVYVNKSFDESLRKMFVVSLDQEELVLVQLDGDLNRVIETAVRERGLSYNN